MLLNPSHYQYFLSAIFSNRFAHSLISNKMHGYIESGRVADTTLKILVEYKHNFITTISMCFFDPYLNNAITLATR